MKGEVRGPKRRLQQNEEASHSYHGMQGQVGYTPPMTITNRRSVQPQSHHEGWSVTELHTDKEGDDMADGATKQIDSTPMPTLDLGFQMREKRGQVL